MVQPLLMSAGYAINKCAFQMTTPEIEPKDQIVVQFSAEKKLVEINSFFKLLF